MNEWPLAVLRWLVGSDRSETLEGDLLELYEERERRKGRRIAQIRLWFDVLDISRPFIIGRESKRYRGMNKNLLKVIWRNMARKRLMTGVNLFGLAMALLVALLITAFVGHEMSYDRYHRHADRIYRVTIEDSNADGPVEHWSRVYIDWVNELPEVFPQIEELVRIQNFRPRNVLVDQQKFREENAFAVDEEIFDVFDFEFVEGNRRALNQAQSVVLTESTSRRYFGTLQSLGREVTMQGHDGTLERYAVTGVIKDQPSNTHLPITLMTSLKEEDRNGWAFVYLKLMDPASVGSIRSGLAHFVKERTPEENVISTELHLQPLTSIHLHSDLARELQANGDFDNLMIFVIVGFVILLVAGINFANLNTVQSLDRAREIGVRKVLGAGKQQIRKYFWLESLLLTFIAGIAAGGALFLALPWFEQFVGKPLIMDWALIGGVLVVAVILTSCFAGMYPAIMLSRYRPIQALKGEKVTRKDGFGVRKVMLAWQFALSIGLISATLITLRQFQYIQEKNLGYSGEQVMAIKNVPDETKRGYETFKTRLKTIAGVEDVSALMELPTQAIRDAGFVTKGNGPSTLEGPRADIQLIDVNFDQFLEMELVAGTGLPLSLKSEPLHPPKGSSVEETFSFVNARRRAYLINESAMRLLGWQAADSVIGQTISWSNGFLSLQSGPIVGVVKDFHQESLRATIDPVVMVYDPVFLNHVLVKLEGDAVARTIEEVEEIWNENYAEFPMEITFLDEEFDKLYQAEQRQLTLVTLFSGLALLIAFLGLFGLIAYTIRLRLKEMAIRKVLGATLPSTVRLFAKEYVIVVLVGAVVAIPVVWMLMNRWLDNYAYHVGISGISFFLATGTIALLMGLTLLVQAWRAESNNPSEILNQE